MRWTAAVGFLSTVALPITLVLTFFGVNAREVDSGLSMFDRHYLPMYIGLAVLAALGLSLSAGLYLQQRRQAARDARRAAEAMTTVRRMTIVRRRPPQLATTSQPESGRATDQHLLAPGTEAAH